MTSLSPIPQGRIIEKLDEYMSRRDYDGAERHLLYWLEEARVNGDVRGRVMVLNELVGHYRKRGNSIEGKKRVEEVILTVNEAGYAGDVTAGTTYVNCATALCAFGDIDGALSLFKKAEECYLTARAGDKLLAGLYNNQAVALANAGDLEGALERYSAAIEALDRAGDGTLEKAVTYLNMADVYEKKLPPEEAEGEIYPLLDKSLALIHSDKVPHDGYYAFVCEKCAPSFLHFGYFLDGEALKKEAEDIYAGRA